MITRQMPTKANYGDTKSKLTRRTCLTSACRKPRSKRVSAPVRYSNTDVDVDVISFLLNNSKPLDLVRFPSGKNISGVTFSNTPVYDIPLTIQ